MASDDQGCRRKHRRSSSPEEAERSSKRHKHRHHSHRHHRHRHHGSKKREEEFELDSETVDTVPSPTRPPNSGPNTRGPDDDVEEGEILEEESFGGRDGEIGKKQTESDAESGEIMGAGDLGSRSDTANLVPYTEETMLHCEDAVPSRKSVGINAKSSKSNNEDSSNGKFISPAIDGEEETWRQRYTDHNIHEGDGSPTRSSAEPLDGKYAREDTGGLGNGYLHPKPSKEDKRQHGELECFKGNEKLKGDYYNEDLEFNGAKVSNRNSSSESGGGKYRTLGSSPSNNRYRSRSRSIDHTHSIIEEYAPSKRRNREEHGSLSYAGRHNTDYDHDGERRVEFVRERGHVSRDLVVDDGRECSSSIYSRETRGTDRCEDRDAEWDVRREKERERSRNREVDHVRGREKEHERSHERDRRNVEKDRSRGREVDRDRRREKERDRSWETVVERDRREKERDRSRDRTRGGERDRVRESERDDKNRERDKSREREKDRGRDREKERDRDRERRDDRNRHKDRYTVNDKDKYLGYEYGNDSRDRYRYSWHSRHEEIDNHGERKRNSEPVKGYNTMGTSLAGGENKLERGEDEQDDLDEKDTFQFAEQEEEDLNRIKEESRRRREAIIAKYKKQQQQAEQTPENEEKDPMDIPAAISEAPDGKNDGVDVFEAETSFSVGKSPPENGNSASEKIIGARGLGEGSPKSERSGDKFCDDIFGETPTGVRKLGKGDGLRVERSGLHDNWDDAEGYYSYRFGEILDGRYEVTAAHGRGVFSTVVRAKNLKTSNGEPEEVAIKIIRNNDTMYKAGLDELVILKKLVGADPDDKRHCVRFLSSFKYRNHLCLVFESLHMNLREVLKKFGRNIGLRLTAVRAYAKQLFIALKHLRNCGVLHCDIKPDNMLVNEAKNVLKLCDFGNAMFAGKNEVTPYLVSRFYRAPEIILGLPYDHPLDMWSVGCCLYELYTGKVLFPGATNNDMLRLHMELKGPFPKKMLRKGAFIEQHFDQDLNFLATEEDLVTKKTIKRLILNIKPKDIGTIITGSPGEDPKMVANFKDLLDKVFVLDPDKRLTVSQALNHPFITGK